MHDQSPLIKSASEKNNFYRSQSSDKPSGTPAGSKNFKKILESEENDQGGHESVDSKQGNEGIEDEPIATKDVPKANPPLHAPVAKSPFALVRPENKLPTTRKTIPASPQSQPTNPDDVNLGMSSLDDANLSKSSLDDANLSMSSLDDANGTSILENDPFNSEIATLDPKLAVPPDEKSSPTPPPTVPSDNTPVIEGEVNKNNTDFASTKKLINTTGQSEVTLEKPREVQRSIKSVSKDDNFNAQFNREQPDFSYVNPLGIPTQQNLVTTAEVPTARPMISANLQSLVEQLVKELSVITTGDKTETSIVLNNPPQFDGVKITITGYESARNEFNLKFENLTPAAQILVNQQQNRADLMSNLEKKGYNVHIFVTTTYIEPAVITAETANTGRERQNPRDGQQREKREEKQ